jgi:radical SAM superfamily enzyme YgiQ (UPF0313 family)
LETKFENINLILLPFWSPLIPPLGLACLKSHLEKNGYKVSTTDLNVIDPFLSFYYSYFDEITQFVPRDKRGNFYSVGQDVLKNHLLAHLNRDSVNNYQGIVEEIVYKTFYSTPSERNIQNLIDIVDSFYRSIDEYLTQLLKERETTIYGFSVYSGNLGTSIYAARLIKTKSPESKVIFGGGVFADQLAPNTENLQKILAKYGDYIDHIIVGEGEDILIKILKNELPEKKMYSLEDINWKPSNINKSEIPDFQDFILSKYPNIAYYTSRSCPFQCSFCSETVQWGKYRRRDSKKVAQDMIKLADIYEKPVLYLGDSLINPNINQISEELSTKDRTLYWDGCLRVDKNCCDIQKVTSWRNAGFYRARFGMESGSKRILEIMNKKITLEEMRIALKNIATAGIKTSTLWIVGHPEETEDDFQQTLNFIEENKEFIYDTEPTPFWYYPTGQSSSDFWLQKYKRRKLYSDEVNEALIVPTWILECEPDRQTIYSRLNRFVKFINDIGVPNPYSLKEIFDADIRWKKLHKNSVPVLVDLMSGQYNDIMLSEKVSVTLNNELDQNDWNF